MFSKIGTIWRTVSPYVWKGVKSAAGFVGDIIAKNPGLVIGGSTKLLKNAKHKKLKSFGDKIGNAINAVHSVTKDNRIECSSDTDISRQIATASNIIGNNEQQQAVMLAHPYIQPYVPYNKNLGGTNFQRYQPRRKKYKRTKVNTSHEVMNPKFAVKGYR